MLPLRYPHRLLFCFGLLLGLMYTKAAAQCLPAASCQPGNAPVANHTFGMGIYRVTLAGLDTATTGAADGYQDYGCRARAAQLGRGASHTLTVRTNPNADESVRAWLDYNNDGQFSAAELVLSSNNARQHTASFTVPATAPAGVALRLRVAADYNLAPVPAACSTPQYSQTEDYRVLVLATAPPRPQARFVALDTISCGAAISFRDQSLHAPAQWRWRFGDGRTSNQQHPQHQYAQPGLYAVTLTVCNAAGCDSLTRSGYVTVRADAPRPAPCQPATTAYCCGNGITRVRLAGIDQPSADGQAGYQDFSCPQRATLTADRPATLQLTTGAVAHDVRVYLDLNDDGQFTAPAERLYQGLAVQSPTVTLNIPATTPGLVYNRPLRLRLVADFAGSPATGPCDAPQLGQVEDYSVVLLPNLAPPAAAFALSYQRLCGPVQVSFSNQTTGAATSYHWDFGDGSTSTLATPPLHTFTHSGMYEVRLVAQNAAGRDTVRRRVVVADQCPTYCVPAGLGGSANHAAYFTRVRLGSIDNTERRTFGVGYRDYTHYYTELQQGAHYTLSAESPPWTFASNPPWVRVWLWLDVNHDGAFGPSELMGVYPGATMHVVSFRVPGNARLGATRLRVLIQEHDQDPISNGCTTRFRNGSTEDYTVLILPPAAPPLPGFVADQTEVCSRTVQLRDTSWFAPTAWRWDFGDGNRSTLQHPQHTYASPGTYTVRLTARNTYGADSVAYAGYVRVLNSSAGAPPAACVPRTGTVRSQRQMQALQLGTYRYPGASSRAGYIDETCAVAPISITPGALLSAGNNQNFGGHCFAWLDANQDGLFDPAELVFSSLGQLAAQNPKTGPLTLPAGTPYGVPLRLRVHWWAEELGQPVTTVPAPCLRDEELGQVRDFTIIATATTAATSPAAPGPAFALFPNPARQQLTLQPAAPLPAGAALHLYSPLGQLVRRYALPRTGAPTLPLGGLPAGTYLARLLGPDGRPVGGAQRLVVLP